jgi:hypothetical protein
MNKLNLRTITNHFQDVQLASLASWSRAKEIVPRDRGGPYIVIQEGYDPDDLTMTPDEFVLGRSGKWLSLSHFFRMPVPERREEFVFGTAAEVMKVMQDLPSKVVMFRPDPKTQEASTSAEPDEMATAYHAGKSRTA